jgi:hypothetical protein
MSSEREAENRWKYLKEFTSGTFAGQEGPERGKLKNLHC